jgi:hypothetical protein
MSSTALVAQRRVSGTQQEGQVRAGATSGAPKRTEDEQSGWILAGTARGIQATGAVGKWKQV